MKKTLRVLSLIVSAFVVLSMAVSAGIAPTLDSTKPNFQINTKNANAGDTVELSVSIANNPGFWSIKLEVSYDDGLSFLKQDGIPVVTTSSLFASQGEATVSYSCSKLTYLFTGNSLSSNVTGNGTLFTFKMNVDEEAVSGDYDVYFSSYSSSNFIDVAGDKVGFTFGDGKITVSGKTTTASGSSSMPEHDVTYSAPSCSPTASLTSGLSTYNQTDLTPAGSETAFSPTAIGDYVDFTLADVPAGDYYLSVYSRDLSGRGTYDVYVDDTLLNSVNFADGVSSVCMSTRTIGQISIEQTKDIVLRFSATTVGKFYIMSFFLDDASYEEKTVDIYTMDENSRPSVYGVTRDYPNTTEIKSVSSNNVLSFQRITNGCSILNRSVYFKLPDNIYTNYSNISSISFDVFTDSGALYSNNNGYNRVFFSSYPTESPNSYNAVKIVGSTSEKYTSTAKTYTISFSASEGKCILDNNYKYINIINSVEINNGNTCNYLYFDNVKLTYKQYNDTTNNSVSIDGENVATVEIGSTFTLPDGDDIIAYKDNYGKYYSCLDEVTVNEDLSFETLSLSLTTYNCAAMRLKSGEVDKQISGIRFYTSFDTDQVEEMRNEGITVDLGTLIAPKNYFGNRPTTDLKLGVDFGQVKNYTTVSFTSSEWFASSDVYGSEFKGIVGSIASITDEHAAWDFVARGYATVTITNDDNTTVQKTVYASGQDVLPERSIAYIAYCVKTSGEYDSLSTAAKVLVDYYYEFYEIPGAGTDPWISDMFD